MKDENKIFLGCVLISAVLIGIGVGILIESINNDNSESYMRDRRDTLGTALWACETDLNVCDVDLRTCIDTQTIEEPDCVDLTFATFDLTDNEMQHLAHLMGLTASGESIDDYLESNNPNANALEAYVFMLDCIITS